MSSCVGTDGRTDRKQVQVFDLPQVWVGGAVWPNWKHVVLVVETRANCGANIWFWIQCFHPEDNEMFVSSCRHSCFLLQTFPFFLIIFNKAETVLVSIKVSPVCLSSALCCFLSRCAENKQQKMYFCSKMNQLGDVPEM